jgi:hypothetical protein
LSWFVIRGEAMDAKAADTELFSDDEAIKLHFLQDRKKKSQLVQKKIHCGLISPAKRAEILDISRKIPHAHL